MSPKKAYVWGRTVKISPKLLLLPSLLILIAFLVVPMLSIFLASFYKYDPFKIMEAIYTLENYRRFFSDPYYIGVLSFTLQMGVGVAALTLALAYPVAYFVSRTKSRLKSVYLFMMLFPLLVGPLVRTYGWMIILGRKGVLNMFLSFFGAEPVELLFTPSAVALATIEVMLPYAVLPLMSSIENIDISIEEAAKSLGADRLRVFHRVLLPLTIPGIASASLLVFALTVSSVITPALLGGPSVMMIGQLVLYSTLWSFNWPFAAATTAILSAITLGTIAIYLRTIARATIAK